MGNEVDRVYLDDEPGLLTKSQRGHLKPGNSDIESGSAHERMVRSRIRERLMNSMNDLSLIHDKIEDRDIQLAVENAFGSEGPPQPLLQPHKNVALILRFLFQERKKPENTEGLTRTIYEDLSNEEVDSELAIEMYEMMFRMSLEQLCRSMNYAFESIEVDVDISGKDLSQDQDLDLESVPISALQILFEDGRITFDEYIKAWEARDNAKVNYDS